ncbi:TetR/AcrR family transcriptional regulator [Arthrobacter sp. FX8]|uniref:TetR/AcrR family transcriptional regulator n=1 Tax=Arthrobacter sp. FX8 TaxID=2997335 RepID=UPI00227A6793|nr:TetR/AcrR family transcriptional regulator [Arthrobacter sp. FX8]WAJ33828.1 TetR/AcrR family transcriptional regulator [Arthrobacter sp. FX8]
MGPAVNGAPPRPRSYDARRRQEAAGEARKRVLAQSRALFLAHGYGRTTIAAIAHAAGVSKESVYKGFGGKPGLVRAIYEQSLLGAGGPPAEERSDRAQATVTDPRELMEQFGRFISEVSPLGSPSTSSSGTPRRAGTRTWPRSCATWMTGGTNGCCTTRARCSEGDSCGRA